MTSTVFNLMDRLGFDSSRRNESNTKYATYMLNNQFGASKSDDHVKFATLAPTINFRGTVGGLPGSAVDYDSLLVIKTEQQRAFEKLQLIQRPFATVPYLGRGASDPVLESRLQQGEMATDKKSVSTVMDKPYTIHKDFPMVSSLKERIADAAFSVEEAALSGWVRGGQSSREEVAFQSSKN
jgi:hypothetical protein